jgi:hypothetical protein
LIKEHFFERRDNFPVKPKFVDRSINLVSQLQAGFARSPVAWALGWWKKKRANFTLASS